MRLADIIAHVARKMDYNPETDTFTDDIREQVNDAYQQLYVNKLWSFAQKETTVAVYADVTATDGITTTGDKQIFTVADFFLDWMEGQVLTAEGVEYEVARVASATEAWLTTVYEGTSGANHTYVVTQRYLDLPVDCEVLLKLVDRTNRDWLFQYTRTEEDLLVLDRTVSGLPDSFIATDQLAVMGPPVSLSAVASTAASTLTAGTYELAYSFVYQGRRGPLSPAVEVTAASGQIITVTLPSTVLGSSYYKTLWGRFGDWEAFRLIQDDITETTTSVVLNSPVETNWLTAERAPWHDGVYQRIRLFEHPNEDNTLSCRYLHRPAPLMESTDSPTFPPAHHMYLVHRVLEDMYSASDNPTGAEMHRRKAEEELGKMKARYLSPETRVWMQGDVTSTWARQPIRRTITHTL